MRKIFTILAFFLLTGAVAFATDPTDSLRAKQHADSVFALKPLFVSPSPFLEEAPDYLNEGLIATANNDSIQRMIDFSRSMINKVRELGSYITSIDEATKFQLPVGIKKEIGGITYELAIHAIRLKPAFAEIDVVMEFTTPQGQTLSFMANAIKFSKKGGIIGDTKLILLGDYAINLNGDKSQIILKGSASQGNTFATIDCDGFKQLGLDAEVKFSRDLLRPENPDGSLGEGNVVSRFTTVLSNWNDLVIQISLPPFQVKGLNGVGFSVSDAVLDMSDLQNAPAVQFPAGYASNQMLPDNPNLWRGFYMRQLVVKLPKEFKQKGSTERVQFSASNVLIDNNGFTGLLKGQNIFPLENGDMNGWAFSLENFEVAIEANNLKEAKFNGQLVIPVSDKQSPFVYSALIQPGGNYIFSVQPSQDVKFNVWKAKVEIYKSSFLEIKVANGKFLPKANLNGRMSVKGSLSEGGQGVELANITFENLQIQSVKPYLKVGNFSFGSEAAQQKMAGFPISIQDIALKSVSDTEVGLSFNLKLNLVGDDGGSFAADAGLTLLGTMDNEGGWQTWKYKDIEVHKIGVDIDGGAFKIKGQLQFYKNDIAYGDGFNGVVKAEFTPGLKVSATAIFGNVGGTRYWYADAMVNFSQGIPIFTGVGIYGFGGGAYYKMKLDNQGQGSELGRTASGLIYVPDAKAGLGLKAVVAIGSHPKPDAFNGEVTFEISFFQGGGVRYISFGGNGYLATPGLELDMSKMKGQVNKLAGQVKKLEAKMNKASYGLLESGGDENSFKELFGDIGANAGKKGQISARVMISYDFENNVLHGNFEAFVNVAGGIIKGKGDGGRAGWAVLHFAPKEWYVYVGTPDDRIGIELGIGPIRAGADSYFMVGTKILSSPPPPANVQRILGGDYNYMDDLNALGPLPGFAFGASVYVSTGDLKFLMFYARFDAGAGFDIMLKNYGDAHCEGSSDRIGINGWYANGQAYAYFDGQIGIRVKVFGRKKKIKILSIAAAALLQAKLPNPFWMRGVVGGRFEVLGGLVRGNCKFQVTLGSECKIVKPEGEERAVDDIQVIAQLTPDDASTEVSVFNIPQVVFTMPVGKVFELSEDEEVKRFRVKLDEFKLVSPSGVVPGQLQWNETSDVLAFNSFDVLPPKQDIKVLAQISFEEYKGGNWIAVLENGKPVTEIQEVKFQTGAAPDYIPHENIEYSYPILGQSNLYRDETRDGYIKLKRGQPYLFNPGDEFKQIARMTDAAGNKTEFAFAVPDNTHINYSIPTGIPTNTVFNFEFVNVPKQASGAIDRNVSDVTKNVANTTEEGNEMAVSSKEAEGEISDLQEKTIFANYVRTSMYTTFNQKLNALTKSDGSSWQIYNGIDELTFRYEGAELFDAFETGTPAIANRLLSFEAILDNNWYTDRVHPIVYDGYPYAGLKVGHRKPVETLGVPPVRAIDFREQSSVIIKDLNPIAGATSASIVYNLPVEMVRDYADLQNQAANLSIDGTSKNPRLNYLLTTPYPVLNRGTYNIRIRYTLPGINKVTSEKIVPIIYKY